MSPFSFFFIRRRWKSQFLFLNNKQNEHSGKFIKGVSKANVLPCPPVASSQNSLLLFQEFSPYVLGSFSSTSDFSHSCVFLQLLDHLFQGLSTFPFQPQCFLSSFSLQGLVSWDAFLLIVFYCFYSIYIVIEGRYLFS